jgi:hypothetical protein
MFFFLDLSNRAGGSMRFKKTFSQEEVLSSSQLWMFSIRQSKERRFSLFAR